MQDRRYLLSIAELLQGDPDGELSERACRLLDEERLARVKKCKNGKRYAENIGAGLLLQLAVREALTERKIVTESNTLAERKIVTESNTLAERKSVTESNTLAEHKTVTESNTLAERKSVTESNTGAESKSMMESNTLAERKSVTESNTVTERETEAECKFQNPRIMYSAIPKRMMADKKIADRIIRDKMTDPALQIISLKVPWVLEYLESLYPPLPLEYAYGEQGKPYLKKYGFHFNLSHSGKYVFCVLSDEETGVDIQWKKPPYRDHMAGRFFSEIEKRFLEQCTDEKDRFEIFYRLWCRKEAYGKLTGQGMRAALGINMLEGAPEGNSGIVPPGVSVSGRYLNGGNNASIRREFGFEEYESEDGYQITICKWRQEL